MHDYAVFGGRLRSAIPFPELLEHEGDGPCDWLLDLQSSLPKPAHLEPLGELTIGEGVCARLSRHPEGFRMDYQDTGTFDISSDGRRISWAPAPDACHVSARLDVLGFVLALALHAAGVYTLHGSAVATAGGVIAFIAPKHHGKSTLASALVAAGARLVTDDSLAVAATGPAVVASPGIHSVRLWEDSFERLRTGLAREVASLNGKRMLQVAEDRRLRRPAPLGAVYVLQPVLPGPRQEAARRIRLEPARSALMLAGHAKLADLLAGTSEAAALLRHAAAIARSVPVYVLGITRDLDRLSEVVESILGWHPLRGGESASTAAGSAALPGSTSDA